MPNLRFNSIFQVEVLTISDKGEISIATRGFYPINCRSNPRRPTFIDFIFLERAKGSVGVRNRRRWRWQKIPGNFGEVIPTEGFSHPLPTFHPADLHSEFVSFLSSFLFLVVGVLPLRATQSQRFSPATVPLLRSLPFARDDLNARLLGIFRGRRLGPRSF